MRRWLATASLVLSLAPVCEAQPLATPPWQRPGGSRSWLVPTLHAAGLLTAQRAAAMLIWPHAFSLADGDRNERRFVEGWTLPPRVDARRNFFQWDGDAWGINFAGHGLMGSEVYLRARQCGQGVLPSILFTAAASAVWEYGVEVFAARPSVNDLIWTPLGGAFFGEVRLALWSLSARLPRAAATVLRVVVDPFGEVERALGSPC